MVKSNLLLALMASTASACKYKLYAAQQNGAGTGPGGYANVTSLEFTLDDATKKGTLKEVASTLKCGQQPSWQHLSTNSKGETIVECIDEGWSRLNGSIAPLVDHSFLGY